MNHLTGIKRLSSSLFNFAKAFVQICGRYFSVYSWLNLNYENRANIGVMLLFSVIVPMQTLIFPFVSSSLKDGYVLINNAFFREMYLNCIFQQTGITYLLSRYDHLVQGGKALAGKCIKSFWRCAHTNNERQ